MDTPDTLGDILNTPQRIQQRLRQAYRDANPHSSPQRRSTPDQRLNSPQRYHQISRSRQRNAHMLLDGSPRRRRPATMGNAATEDENEQVCISFNYLLSVPLMLL